tara:strand:+ start:785 stop:1009 length:225 start_codon:yes stop_codon:yes gene_type:complete
MVIVLVLKLLLVSKGSYTITLPGIFEVGIESVNVIEYDGFGKDGIFNILYGDRMNCNVADLESKILDPVTDKDL